VLKGATHRKRADFDHDGDVNSTDLTELAADPDLLDLSIFAAEFGATACN
jgi:hypothetical protein